MPKAVKKISKKKTRQFKKVKHSSSSNKKDKIVLI